MWDTGSADAKASLHETKRLQVEYKSISDEVRQLNQRIQHGVRSPGESESDYYARRGQMNRRYNKLRGRVDEIEKIMTIRILGEIVHAPIPQEKLYVEEQEEKQYPLSEIAK